MSHTISRQKFQQIFKVYDQKRTGQIKTQQIAKLIRSARLFPSQDDIQRLQRNVDPNRQGSFNMNRFVEVALEFANSQSKINHQQQLLKAFSFFDEEQNGYISESDLRKIMAAFGQPLGQQQMKQILKFAKAINGKIYYRDFVKTIINGKLD